MKHVWMCDVCMLTELHSPGKDAELHDQLSPRCRHQRRRTIGPQSFATRARSVSQAAVSASTVVIFRRRRRRVQGTQGRVVGLSRRIDRRRPRRRPWYDRYRRRVRPTGRLSVRKLLYLNQRGM